MLPRFYRVIVVNEAEGQLPEGRITVWRNAWYYRAAQDGSGRVAYEDTETQIYVNPAIILPGDTHFGSEITNENDGYLGAYFSVQANFIGNLDPGPIKIYLQAALASSTWETGNGHLIAEFDMQFRTIQRKAAEFEYFPDEDATAHDGGTP